MLRGQGQCTQGPRFAKQSVPQYPMPSVHIQHSTAGQRHPGHCLHTLQLAHSTIYTHPSSSGSVPKVGHLQPV